MFLHLACHRLFHLCAFAALVAPRTLTEVFLLSPRFTTFLMVADTAEVYFGIRGWVQP